MKKHFGEFVCFSQKQAKRLGMSFEDYYRQSEERSAEFFAKLLGTELATGQRMKQSILYEMRLEMAILKGHAHHFFIEDESLGDWMCQTVTKANPEILDVFASGYQHQEPFIGIIHTTGKDARGVLFAIDYGNIDPALLDFDPDASPPCLTVHCTPGDPNMSGNFSLTFGALQAAQLRLPARSHGLVLGLALYLKCFPHALKEGFPDFAKHHAHFKGERCFGVGTAPQILDRGSPVPHWRSGHYRILRSPVFTKKRYQVVWVKGAVVNGGDGGFYTIEDVRP